MSCLLPLRPRPSSSLTVKRSVSAEISPLSFSGESFHNTRGSELPPAAQPDLSAGNRALTGLPGEPGGVRALEEPVPSGLSARAHLEGKEREMVPTSQPVLWVKELEAESEKMLSGAARPREHRVRLRVVQRWAHRSISAWTLGAPESQKIRYVDKLSLFSHFRGFKFSCEDTPVPAVSFALLSPHTLPTWKILHPFRINAGDSLPWDPFPHLSPEATAPPCCLQASLVAFVTLHSQCPCSSTGLPFQASR